MRWAWTMIPVAFVLVCGCAQKDWIDRTLVTVDVTGVWEGTQDFGPGGGGTRDIVIVLEQHGAKVTGEIRNSATALGVGAPPDTPVEGTVNGDTLSLSGQRVSVVLRVNGDEMAGSGGGNRSFRVSLRRRPQ